MRTKLCCLYQIVDLIALLCILFSLFFGLYPELQFFGSFFEKNIKIHINWNFDENAPAWAQAILSFFAIAASFGGIWWQLHTSSKNQQKKEREISIKTSETCFEMCNALLSIIRAKSELLGRFDRRSEIESPEQVEAIKTSLWNQFMSVERIDDLQQVLRLLVAKDMPIELLRTMFTLQKLVAKYKEFIIHFERGQELSASLLTPSDRTRVGLEHFGLKKEISRLTKRIAEYKEVLAISN